MGSFSFAAGEGKETKGRLIIKSRFSYRESFAEFSNKLLIQCLKESRNNFYFSTE